MVPTSRVSSKSSKSNPVLADGKSPSTSSSSAVQKLCKQEKSLPPNRRHQRYIRRALDVPNGNGESTRVIICMSPAMSMELLKATTLQSDTSHKRSKIWLEFELGTWCSLRKRGTAFVRYWFE